MSSTAAATLLSPKENGLLAAMPDADYQALMPALERVTMPLGRAVYEAGEPQGFVYFPTTSIVSLLYVLADGATAEIAVTGRDGLVGIALFMGGETTPSRAVVQTAVCNRHHSVDQQLCRWLLLTLDRLSGSKLLMTQELIANMLGVRREGVT